jgi:two-component system sensor kinase FixL
MEQRVNQLQGDLVHMARVSAVNEMGAALAHELNQPLTAIMLYLQGLVHALSKHETPPLNDAEQAILTKAIKETERAGQIIQRMRHFIEKKQSERKSITLRYLIEDAVELVRLSARQAVKIESHYDKNQHVEVDPIQIQQILVNLLRNACEAVQGQEHPWIRITSERQEPNIILSVTDSGPGIPAHDVPNLFKTFSSQKKNGMGLGLAISRSLAQSHGGDLTVDAGGEGVGATFRLKLPLSQTRGHP